MLSRLFRVVTCTLVVYGCGSSDQPAVNSSDTTASALSAEPSPADATEADDAPSNRERESAGGGIAISPENTSIQFVGTHIGDDPNPRTGEFGAFSGSAQVDAGSETLQAVSVEIQTASLTTEIGNLTTHLQSPDFFDVREHPTATFESTRVVSTGDATMVTGNLTLLGETKEISFPADVTVSNGDLVLNARFLINRSEFGMDFGLDRVHDAVELIIKVGGAE